MTALVSAVITDAESGSLMEITVGRKEMFYVLNTICLRLGEIEVISDVRKLRTLLTQLNVIPFF